MGSKATSPAKAQPRSEAVVFADLAALCASPGYAHALAYLCSRDNVIRYRDEMTVDDMDPMYSTKRLIRSEITLLTGLLAKGNLDIELPAPDVMARQVVNTEDLLVELHEAMGKPLWQGLQPDAAAGDISRDILSSGQAMREPMFYGGESAYSHQYRDLAPRKYGGDNGWLIENKGFSIGAAHQVMKAIGALADSKLARVEKGLKNLPDEKKTVLPGFTSSLNEVTEAAGVERSVVESVVNAFAMPAGNKNVGFGSPLDFNLANPCPILKLDNGQFLLFHRYSLVESLYESPFHWMWNDARYRSVAVENRGRFTEDFSAERLEAVFGKNHVFRGVDILGTKGKIMGEIDVLIIFGNRAIVLQAKSKRLTVEARRGSDTHLQDDFKKAVQDAYDQAYSCAEAMAIGQYTLVERQGRTVSLPTLKRIYLLCVESEHYPALSFQSRQFLKVRGGDQVRFPFVMDVFLLDAMTEMLSSPLRLLSYIDRRIEYADKVYASHELTILAFHLKNNLWFEKEYGHVHLSDDISADLDLAMHVRRDGVKGSATPDGVLTRLSPTAVGKVVSLIEANPHPATIDLGYFLLSLGEDTVRTVSEGLDKICAQTRRDKGLHDLTIFVSEGDAGLTVHCSDRAVNEAGPKLEGHCRGRKYKCKANAWYGLCLSSSGDVRFGISLESEWERDPGMDAATQQFADQSNWSRGRSLPKVGRNDPCPCGSGLKFKKCHLNT